MVLALSSLISEIDRYSADKLGISVRELMGRAGRVVADTVRERVREGGAVVILAGKGNNGGDGYAAAVELMDAYDVTVYDVFSAGQKTEEGKYYLGQFTERGGKVLNLTLDGETKENIKRASCIVDAIFGTGFRGEIPKIITELAKTVSQSVGSQKIAIDVPMGLNADLGSVEMDSASEMQVTVALSFIKPGLVSFPARAYVGEIIYNDLGLPLDELKEKFDFPYHLTDSALAAELLPKREENSSKGNFGKLLCITGSGKYRGAAHLSLEAALRGGAGYVTYMGEEKLCAELSGKYPEAIYKPIGNFDGLLPSEIESVCNESGKHTATLIGSGSGNSEGLFRLTEALLRSEGSPIILDADAINVLADNREAGLKAIRESRRTVILTPHPLEFARISGNDVSYVQLNRMEEAMKFAAENNCILALKGAATVVTDGKSVYINSSGSSALAKAGSGDVLAGFVASLTASGADPLTAAALSVYFHGAASDALSAEFSTFGVTPSDLPRQIAREIATAQKSS